jgi:ABC-type multidrug transport system fused ATPase/permease subunit
MDGADMSVAGRGPDRRGWAGSALAALIRRRFSRFLLVGAVTGIASLSTVLLPWASKSIVDALGAGFSWPVFLRGAALLFGALILRSAAGGWASFLAARIQLRLLREILEIIHTRILKVPFLEMKRYQSGQLASHTLNDARLLVSGFGGAVNALIRFPVEIVSLLAFLAATDLGLAGLGLAAMASAALFSHWKSRATARMADRAIRQNAALHALVGENLALNKIIRLFGRCTGSGHGGYPRGRAGPQRIVFASFVA